MVACISREKTITCVFFDWKVIPKPEWSLLLWSRQPCFEGRVSIKPIWMMNNCSMGVWRRQATRGSVSLSPTFRDAMEHSNIQSVISWGGGIGSDNGLGPTKRRVIIRTMVIRLLTHICVTWPQSVKTTVNLPLHITFIFDGWCCYCAAATPVIYEINSEKTTGNFAKSKNSFAEKLTNGVLSTPLKTTSQGISLTFNMAQLY